MSQRPPLHALQLFPSGRTWVILFALSMQEATCYTSSVFFGVYVYKEVTRYATHISFRLLRI
jgi:hypothetical protein